MTYIFAKKALILQSIATVLLLAFCVLSFFWQAGRVIG